MVIAPQEREPLATGVNMFAGRAAHKSANAAFFPEIAQEKLGRNRRRGEENHQIPTRCVGTHRFRYAAVVALPTKAAYNDSLKIVNWKIE
jgi:hypothetical protein